MTFRLGRFAALSCAGLVLAASGLPGAESSLRMHVSPAVSRAPGFVIIRVSVEKAADNRLLRVVAESPDFFRSSEIPVDGRNAPALSVFQFRDLPTGLYQITGTLIGVNGERAVVARMAKVEPAAGGPR